MSITQSKELFTAINLVIIGLSHFFQPKYWIDFSNFYIQKKRLGIFLVTLYGLAFKTIFFLFIQNKKVYDFEGLALILKGLFYFSIGIKSIGKVNIKNANKFKWAGIVMIIFFHLDILSTHY